MGKKEKSEEWICVIKSTDRNYAIIEKTIKKIHSYETPEIIVLPIIKGSRSYLDWIDEVVK